MILYTIALTRNMTTFCLIWEIIGFKKSPLASQLNARPEAKSNLEVRRIELFEQSLVSLLHAQTMVAAK